MQLLSIICKREIGRVLIFCRAGTVSAWWFTRATGEPAEHHIAEPEQGGSQSTNCPKCQDERPEENTSRRSVSRDFHFLRLEGWLS